MNKLHQLGEIKVEDVTNMEEEGPFLLEDDGKMGYSWGTPKKKSKKKKKKSK
jgi:hypothetical protein